MYLVYQHFIKNSLVKQYTSKDKNKYQNMYNLVINVTLRTLNVYKVCNMQHRGSFNFLNTVQH